MKTMNRNGFTLIELVLLFTVLSIVCSCSLALVNHLTKLSTATTEHQTTVREVRRLATSFRDQIHAASQVTIGDPATSISIDYADGSKCEWVQSNSGIDSKTIGPINRVEHFRLSKDSSIEFISDAVTSIVSLKLTSPLPVRSSLQVDASLPKQSRPSGADK